MTVRIPSNHRNFGALSQIVTAVKLWADILFQERTNWATIFERYTMYLISIIEAENTINDNLVFILTKALAFLFFWIITTSNEFLHKCLMLII